MRIPAIPFVLFGLLVPLAAPVPAAAQTSAADVLNRAYRQYEARMANVENYTLVQRVMGVETTIHFEREMVDGSPVYRPSVTAAGGRIIAPGDDADQGANPYDLLAAFAERATLEDRETVDGRDAHVIRIDDFSGMPGMAPSPGDGEFTVRTGRLYIDAANHLVRRMVFEGAATVGGESHPVTMDMRMEDYRDVQGMMHPFRTVMRTTGLSPRVSQAEMEEARRSMAELEAQMKSMPAAQRQMMERMVRPQMEQFQAMLDGEAMEVTIEVTELRVNQGTPTGR
jgi:hypothetical protein